MRACSCERQAESRDYAEFAGSCADQIPASLDVGFLMVWEPLLGVWERNSG